MLRAAPRFQYLASLVFVVSLCAFLGMRWVAETRSNSAHPATPAVESTAYETTAADDSALPQSFETWSV